MTTTIDNVFTSVPQLNNDIARNGRHSARGHSVIPEGNLSVTTPNGTGALQGFAQILAGVSGTTGASNSTKLG